MSLLSRALAQIIYNAKRFFIHPGSTVWRPFSPPPTVQVHSWYTQTASSRRALGSGPVVQAHGRCQPVAGGHRPGRSTRTWPRPSSCCRRGRRPKPRRSSSRHSRPTRVLSGHISGWPRLLRARRVRARRNEFETVLRYDNLPRDLHGRRRPMTGGGRLRCLPAGLPFITARPVSAIIGKTPQID